MFTLNQLLKRSLCLGAALSMIGASTAFANNQAHHQAMSHQTGVMTQHNQMQNMSVLINTTQIVHLPGNASSVIVGNPLIADISIYSPNTIFVIGRGYGQTNLIALDEDGQTILQSNILVRRDTAPTSVHITNIGEGQTTFNCAPDCLPAPILGDTSEFIGQFTPQAAAIASVPASNNSSSNGFGPNYAGGNALPAILPPGPSQAQAQALAHAMSQPIASSAPAPSPFSTGKKEY